MSLKYLEDQSRRYPNLGEVYHTIDGIPIYGVILDVMDGMPSAFALDPADLDSISEETARAISIWCKEHKIDLYIALSYEWHEGFGPGCLGEWLDRDVVDLIQKSDFFTEDFKKSALKYYDTGIDERTQERRRIEKAKDESRKLQRNPGYVYLMKSSTGLYKIGQTTNPNQRLTSFKKLPFTVSYDHLIKTKDRIRLEKRLHKKFAKRRSEGEWFNLSSSDVNLIKRIKSDDK